MIFANKKLQVHLIG